MGATCATAPTEGDHFVRILLLGESNTGKSTLARRYFNFDVSAQPREETFAPNHYETRTIEIDKTNVDLELLDMTGSKNYENVSDIWFKECNAVLLVYDVSRPKTFQSMDLIMKKLTCAYGKETLRTLPIAIAANKVDLLGKNAKKIPKSYKKYPIFGTSAKNNIGVNNAFTELLRLSLKA